MVAEIRRLAAGLLAACPPAHWVSVSVVAAESLVLGPAARPGRPVFGIFLWPRRGAGKTARVRLVVAGELANVLCPAFVQTRGEAVAVVGRVFLRQWVHYERWRDDKDMAERFVAARVRRLAARLGV